MDFLAIPVKEETLFSVAREICDLMNDQRSNIYKVISVVKETNFWFVFYEKNVSDPVIRRVNK